MLFMDGHGDIPPRRPLRDDVREAVLSRIARGLHPVGSRIHEGNLATELRVSRTPVREALMALETLGVLEVKPNSGFFVAAVSDRAVRDIYPMIGALERLAVVLTDEAVLRSLIPELQAVNEAFRTTGDGSSRIAEGLDERWHRLLTSSCGNTKLRASIEDLKRSVQRYEVGDMADATGRQRSADQHEQVINQILASRLDRAGDAVMLNWMDGMRRVLTRGTTPGGADTPDAKDT